MAQLPYPKSNLAYHKWLGSDSLQIRLALSFVRSRVCLIWIEFGLKLSPPYLPILPSTFFSAVPDQEKDSVIERKYLLDFVIVRKYLKQRIESF